MDLYSAFDGDPINTFDPTGRCATDTSSSSGGFLGELAQVVVSLVAGALGIDEVPLSAAFGDVVGKAVVNVVLMVAVDVVVAVVAPEAEPFLIAEEIGGEAAVEGGAALLEEGGAVAAADGEGLAATTEEAVEEVGVTEDALNGANVVETTVEEGAATAEATVNVVEDGAEAEVAVGKGIQSAETGSSEASAETITAGAEETEAGGIEASESQDVQEKYNTDYKSYDEYVQANDPQAKIDALVKKYGLDKHLAGKKVIYGGEKMGVSGGVHPLEPNVIKIYKEGLIGGDRHFVETLMEEVQHTKMLKLFPESGSAANNQWWLDVVEPRAKAYAAKYAGRLFE